MKRFRAYATISYDLICEFEVEDDEIDEDFTPFQYARDNLDGSDFTEIPDSSDWNVYEVEEIKEQENEL
jgi:hypothetical protein